MAQLQEVRASCANEEAKVSSLRKELQDTSRELGEALSKINLQVSAGMGVAVGGVVSEEVLFPQQATKIDSLQAEMKEMVTNHEKNMKKKDSEVWQQLVEQNWKEGEEVQYRPSQFTVIYVYIPPC